MWACGIDLARLISWTSERPGTENIVPHAVLWPTGSRLNTAVQSEHQPGETVSASTAHNIAHPEPYGKLRTWWHCASSASVSSSNFLRLLTPAGRPRLPPRLPTNPLGPLGFTNHQPTLRPMGSGCLGVLIFKACEFKPVAPCPSQSPSLAVPPVSHRHLPVELGRAGQSLCPVAPKPGLSCRQQPTKTWICTWSLPCAAACVCQRRAGANKQTLDEHSRIAGADPKSWGSSSKVYPLPSAAGFLTSDACSGLCACYSLRG